MKMSCTHHRDKQQKHYIQPVQLVHKNKVIKPISVKMSLGGSSRSQKSSSIWPQFSTKRTIDLTSNPESRSTKSSTVFCFHQREERLPEITLARPDPARNFWPCPDSARSSDQSYQILCKVGAHDFWIHVFLSFFP